MIDSSLFNPLLLIMTLLAAATPVLLAATGELVAEKSGVLNLGVEGMMVMGAAVGFVFVIDSQSLWLGFGMAIVAGIAMSLIFALLTQFLLSNQVATGLALTLFGLGLSALIADGYTGFKPPAMPKMDVKGWHSIVWGHDAIVYVSIVLVAIVYAVLRYSRWGLIIRAVGENHHAAHALGYKVIMVRTLCLMFGGACAGLGGAYLSLVRVPQWTDGMTAGVGWIALAIVVFASWKPWRVMLGAYLFGGITLLQLNLQIMGFDINVAFLSMTPYLITIAVLVLMSARKATDQAPKSLGQLFHRNR